MSKPLRGLESFERELAGCGDGRDAFRMALDGLVNNTFTRSLREINETNLPTLELRNPDAYATIKDQRIREALVTSCLFQVARHRGPGAAEDLEICWDERPDSERLLRAIVGLTEGRKSAIPPPGGWPCQAYEGGDAVKVFLRALDAVIKVMGKSDWDRFDVLHRIAHGRERRYGTPLDEIRIYAWHTPSSLAKALKRISGSKNL